MDHGDSWTLRDDRRSDRVSRALAVVAWVLLLLATLVLVHDLDAGKLGPTLIYESDVLYPAGLYLDLQHTASWTAAYAGYFVPDLVLFFLLMSITNSILVSAYLFVFVQYLALVAAMRWLFGAVLAEDRRLRRTVQLYTALAGAAVAIFILRGLHGRGTLLELFLPACHVGAVLLCVLGLAVTMTLLGRPRELGHAWRRQAGLLSLLFLISLLGTLSDKLLVVLFVAPVTVTLAVFYRRLGRGALLPVLTILAGGFLGGLAAWWLNSLGGFQLLSLGSIDTPRVLATVAEIPRREENFLGFVIDRFFLRFGVAYRAYWIAWLLATLVLLFATKHRLLRRGPLRGVAQLSVVSRQNLTFMATFLVCSLILTAGASVYVTVGLYGAKVGYPHSILFTPRYLLAFFFIPLVAWALYLPVLSGPRRSRLLAVPITGLLAVLLAPAVASLDLRDPFPRRRFAEVVCIDRLAELHGWRFGLANDVAARRIAYFSRQEVRADPVHHDLSAGSWLTSRARHGEDAGYDFVILNGLDHERVLDTLGPPDQELRCEPWTVLAYDQPRLLEQR
jgi:hypothetical protein